MRTDARGEQAAHKRSLILTNYKLIVSEPQGQTELYNLHADPRELLNLAADQPERVRAMRSRLGAQALAAEGSAPAPAKPYEPSLEEVKQLETLGYIEDRD